MERLLEFLFLPLRFREVISNPIPTVPGNDEAVARSRATDIPNPSLVPGLLLVVADFAGRSRRDTIV